MEKLNDYLSIRIDRNTKKKLNSIVKESKKNRSEFLRELINSFPSPSNNAIQANNSRQN